jgi:exodeoxyribonuclease V beta subunit
VSSFTALTASDPLSAVTLSHDHELDEASDLPVRLDLAPAARWPVPEGFAQLTPGADTGILLHAILEQLDFRPCERHRLGDVVVRELKRRGLADKFDAVALTGSLGGVLDAPLLDGGALTLASTDAGRRVSEMEFALPVASPDGSAITSVRLAEVFRSAPNPTLPGDYATQVAKLRFEPAIGFLRGYIDLVFEHEGRWYLIDYKSNTLGPGVEDYSRQNLGEVMADHHYYLQYHLYAVALDRMLRLRAPHYDYDRDFGGILYLFVRGMTPEHTPTHGVFFDRPPKSTLLELSALFGRVQGGDS